MYASTNVDRDTLQFLKYHLVGGGVGGGGMLEKSRKSPQTVENIIQFRTKRLFFHASLVKM